MIPRRYLARVLSGNAAKVITHVLSDPDVQEALRKRSAEYDAKEAARASVVLAVDPSWSTPTPALTEATSVIAGSPIDGETSQ
jgi:hypothetical protein